MAASTTALPPTYLHGERPAIIVGSCCSCCKAGQLLAVRFEACAGRGVRRLCPPSVACSAGFMCLLAFAMPCPLPFSTFLPPFILLCPLFIPCAPGSSRKLERLSCWQLQHGPAVAARASVDSFTFFLQSPLILGHG